MDIYHILAWAAVGYYLLICAAHLLHLVMGRTEALKWKTMGYSEEVHRLSRGVKVPPLTLVADMRKVAEDHVMWADRLLSQRFPRMEFILLYPRWEEEALKVVEAFYLRQLDFVTGTSSRPRSPWPFSGARTAGWCWSGLRRR